MVAPRLLDQHYGPGRTFTRRPGRPSRLSTYEAALAAARAAGDRREIRKQERLIRINHSLPHRMHGAWDITAPEETPIYAPVAGVVVSLRARVGYGNTVILVHPEPPATYAAGNRAPRDAGGTTSTAPITTAYCHLNRWAEGLTEGQEIAENSVVGYVGHTNSAGGESGAVGRIGDHLHFGVHLVSIDETRAREHSYRDAQGFFDHYASSGRLMGRRSSPDFAHLVDGAWVKVHRVRGFDSSYEEDWRRYIEPDQWIRELHGLAPGDPLGDILGDRVERS